MIKYPQKKNIHDIKKFFRQKGLSKLVNAAEEKALKTNELRKEQSYRPELIDLYNLYQFIVKNKRITSLEFGCGWSSLVIALALRDNKKNFKDKINNLRRNNPFQNFIVDNEKKYIGIAKKRIEKFDKTLLKDSFFLYSQVKLIEYDLRYVTEYTQIPKVNPDFIYLDGPDQFKLIFSNNLKLIRSI